MSKEAIVKALQSPIERLLGQIVAPRCKRIVKRKLGRLGQSPTICEACGRVDTIRKERDRSTTREVCIKCGHVVKLEGSSLPWEVMKKREEELFHRACYPNKSLSLSENALEVMTAFDVYAAKGPVNYPGPQLKADQAWRVFQHLLTGQESHQLSTARIHACWPGPGEDREEHDLFCIGVRPRLIERLINAKT